jgi:hypothetical protein
MGGENSLRRFAEEKNAGVSSLGCARDFGARLSSQPALSNGAERSCRTGRAIASTSTPRELRFAKSHSSQRAR